MHQSSWNVIAVEPRIGKTSTPPGRAMHHGYGAVRPRLIAVAAISMPAWRRIFCGASTWQRQPGQSAAA